MKFNEEMKSVLCGAPYVSVITLCDSGKPHAIIAGGKEISEDSIAIGIYKMEATQKNLKSDDRVWILASTIEGGAPKGYRFEGKASIKEGKLVFVPETAEALI